MNLISRLKNRKRRREQRKRYIELYERFYTECMYEAVEEWQVCFFPSNTSVEDVANQFFEEQALAEHIVGYYLSIYRDNALRVWRANVENKELTEQDKEVERILCDLVGEV